MTSSRIMIVALLAGLLACAASMAAVRDPNVRSDGIEARTCVAMQSRTRTYILRPTHNRGTQTSSSAPARSARAIDDGAEAVTPLAAASVESLHATTHVHSRFANTLVTSRVKNVRNVTAEVRVRVVLPEHAFITNFTMLVDGVVIVGEVKEKAEAKEMYEAARARGQSAGLVAQSPRASNVFATSVSVAALSKVTFNLTYQEILQREHSLYRHQFNIDLPHPISDLRVTVTIEEQTRIVDYLVADVTNTTSKATNAALKTAAHSAVAVIDATKITSTHSVLSVVYAPTAAQQKRLVAVDGTISAQLAVLYDVQRANDGGEVRVVNGYFVHFFAPAALPVVAKRAVFVVDTSGSMSGTKMAQTKVAMRNMLAALNADDEFVIVEFDDDVHAWRDEFSTVNEDNIAKATAFVDALTADGSTNIDDAMRRALDIVQAATKGDDKMVPLVVFMTDGQATAGETNTARMLDNVGNWTTDMRVPIHTLAFGRGADYTLMKSISMLTAGLARKIYEDSDADLQMQGFYAQIGNPMLTNVVIDYLNETVNVDSIVVDNAFNYYEGGEIVIVGRLADYAIDAASTAPRPFARIVGTGDIERGWTCVLPMPHPIAPTEPPIAAIDTLGGYVQRMWAYRTIKKLLDEHSYGHATAEAKTAAKAKALSMSLEYNFVTELTSMVVVQSANGTDEESATSFGDSADMSMMASHRGGMANMNQMSYSMAMRPAPRRASNGGYQAIPQSMTISHSAGPQPTMMPTTTTTSTAETTTSPAATTTTTVPPTCSSGERTLNCDDAQCHPVERTCAEERQRLSADAGAASNTSDTACAERNCQQGWWCYCGDDSVRNEAGECVHQSLCPGSLHSSNIDANRVPLPDICSASANEVYNACGDLCDAKCGDVGPQICLLMCAPGGCVCAPDHARNADNACVLKTTCAAASAPSVDAADSDTDDDSDSDTDSDDDQVFAFFA